MAFPKEVTGAHKLPHVIGVCAFAFHQGVQPAVAESTTFVRQLHQMRR
jgi:hypothetical protein